MLEKKNKCCYLFTVYQRCLVYIFHQATMAEDQEFIRQTLLRNTNRIGFYSNELWPQVTFFSSSPFVIQFSFFYSFFSQTLHQPDCGLSGSFVFFYVRFFFFPFVTVLILKKQKNKIQLQITLSFGRNISKCVIISIGVWCKYYNVIASRVFSCNYRYSILFYIVSSQC